LQIAVHIGGWVPLAWLTWSYTHGNLTVNWIQALTQRTGKIALIFLVLSLACTPANTLFGIRQALKVRRPFGLYAFMYASLHFLTFTGLDYSFDWSLLKGAIFEKPFVLVGLGALLILIALAVTSFRWWMKRMGRNWTRLHWLVYLAAGLVILHYAWALKGDIFRLKGNILGPVGFGLTLLFLLVLRIRPIRRWITKFRSEVNRHWARIYHRKSAVSADEKGRRTPRSLRLGN
jgi:sulfoxide reductase heme-binding subunit YedZ